MIARHLWVVTAREARAHALILCAALWLVAAVTLVQPGRLDPFGRLKFPDFVHFYTLGSVAAAAQFDQLYDADALHLRQVEHVPESSELHFVPIYAPHTALIFLPLSFLPYLGAAWVWAGVTAAAYSLAVWVVWRPLATILTDRWLVAAAAFGFPPFWSLILHGQTTMVPLMAFSLAWLALRRGSTLHAGMALGLLSVKPQFGLVLAVLTLVCREWALLAGAVASVALQAGATAAIMGPNALVAYAGAVTHIAAITPQLEPKPFQLHSVRALTELLPGQLATVVYLLAVLGIAWQASRAWKSAAPLSVRFAVVVLASALASAHMTVYDVTVIALPLVWIGAWVRECRPGGLTTVFAPLVYLLFLSLLVPSSLFIGVQMSVILLGALLWVVVREMRIASPPLLPRADRGGTVPA